MFLSTVREAEDLKCRSGILPIVAVSTFPKYKDGEHNEEKGGCKRLEYIGSAGGGGLKNSFVVQFRLRHSFHPQMGV